MHTQPVTMRTRSSAGAVPRPEVSVYWKPGCSMCLKAKEFVEENRIAFESLNVFDRRDSLEELTSAGLRGLPVVRRGDRLIYAQSLDDIAEFLGVTRDARDSQRLPQDQLLERWDQVLERARTIIAGFSEEQLERRAMLIRDRSIKQLSSHVFQIVEAFMLAVDDGLRDTRSLQGDARADIVTRADLLAYVDRMLAAYRDWQKRGRADAIGDSIVTFWGDQPSGQVLERFVWHSTQHARQLDAVAAGMGAELQIPPELYAGLPLPKRLWA